MLNFGNKEFRNLQEQVGKNQEDIASLKSGFVAEYDVDTTAQLSQFISEQYVGKIIYNNEDGHAYLIARRQLTSGYDANDLGEYPAKGPKGDTGNTGSTGASGRQPKIGVGYGPLPQDADWQYRDLYIIKGSQNGFTKGDVYQKDENGVWKNQFNIVGPQGVPGTEGDEVIANPEGEEYVGVLRTVMIDGLTYQVVNIVEEDQDWIDSLKDYLVYDEDNAEVQVGTDLYVDGSVETGADIVAGRNLIIDDLSKLQDPDGNSLSNVYWHTFAFTYANEVTNGNAVFISKSPAQIAEMTVPQFINFLRNLNNGQKVVLVATGSLKYNSFYYDTSESEGTIILSNFEYDPSTDKVYVSGIDTAGNYHGRALRPIALDPNKATPFAVEDIGINKIL